MYPQRLPIVDDDDGVWGDILRKYLTKEHFNDDTNNSANGGHKNVTIRAGTAGTGGAPLKFTSGTLLTSPEVGAVEFAGDNLYLTQTSSAIRKKLALYDDTAGATGDIYYRSASGYFTALPAGSSNQILSIASGLPSWQTSNSYTVGGTDVTVADGGTGRSTSTTAYGIIAAGTTATGAHQTISPGSSGQFLKSAGAASLAIFSNITAADFTGTTAQFNTALTDNDFATLSGAETLTNKTINIASNIISGIPYDLSIMGFGTYTARVANSYGDFPMGVKLQRAITFTQVVYRVNVADASGNLVVELRKNGTTVAGSSATIAAANQVAGGTATGTWAFADGDIITIYVTAVGATPGAGLIADIRGSTG